jgi:hypothetical protein
VEEGSKLAIEFHSQLTVLCHKPNFFDEPAEAFRRLQAGVLVIEGFRRG